MIQNHNRNLFFSPSDDLNFSQSVDLNFDLINDNDILNDYFDDFIDKKIVIKSTIDELFTRGNKKYFVCLHCEYKLFVKYEFLDDDTKMKKYLNEIKISSRINEIFDKKYFFGFNFDEKNFNFFTKFIEGKTLNKIEMINDYYYMDIMKNICSQIDKLHKNNIVHLDIKHDNIIVDNNDNPHLIDFGESSFVDDYDGEIRGAKMCMSPEIRFDMIDDKNILYKCDIWSFGILCLTTYDNMYIDIIKNMMNDDFITYEQFQKNIIILINFIKKKLSNKKICDLITLCIDPDYTKRPPPQIIFKNFF